MTTSIPVTFFHNRQQIRFVNDMSFNLPEVGSEQVIEKQKYKVVSRAFMPSVRGKKALFVNLEKII